MPSYPWAGFGSFQFTKDERPIFNTDLGWFHQPTYVQNRALGSATDIITTMAIGSYLRSVELFLTKERFELLESLINTKAVFTDWFRPTPDSRQAFLSEVVPVEFVIMASKANCAPGQALKLHTKFSLISQ